MDSDRLALYGALCIAAGAALHYFPLGVVSLGAIIVGAALLRAWATQRGQNG